ncbi:MAG: trypco2 family protein [Planctomycetota bacterium]|jgi:hypothetical protein
MEKTFNIKDIIHSVQNELYESQEERIQQGKPPLFVVRELEIEAKVAIINDKTRKGGFDLKIITADQQGKISENVTHKVKLRLEIPNHEERKSLIESSQGLDDFGICPSCRSKTLDSESGVVSCIACGYSKCEP